MSRCGFCGVDKRLYAENSSTMQGCKHHLPAPPDIREQVLTEARARIAAGDSSEVSHDMMMSACLRLENVLRRLESVASELEQRTRQTYR